MGEKWPIINYCPEGIAAIDFIINFILLIIQWWMSVGGGGGVQFMIVKVFVMTDYDIYTWCW